MSYKKQFAKWVGMVSALLFFMASPLMAGRIVLKNGKVIKCAGRYEVKESTIEYKDNHGNLYRLPLKVVDLARCTQSDTVPKKKVKVENYSTVTEGSIHGMVESSGIDDDEDRSAEVAITSEDVNFSPRVRNATADEDDPEWTDGIRLSFIQEGMNEGDVHKVARYIRPGLPLDGFLYNATIRQCNPRMAAVLLDNGANANERYNGNTLLHEMLKKGTPDCLDIVPILLKYGADPDASSEGKTPLQYLSEKRNPDLKTIGILLKFGADPNFGEITSQLPLHYAFERNDMALIALLVEYGADLDSPDSQGISPIFRAIERSDENMVLLLIENQVKLNRSTNDGNIPLMEAVHRGETKIVSLLVKGGADVDKIAKGTTALLKAAADDNLAMVQLLLTLGANPNKKLPGKDTAAMLAVRNGSEVMLGLLLDKGVEIHAPPLLPIAVESNKLSMARTLLKAGADPNSLNENNDPCLVLAARHGSLPMVQALVAAGADVYLKSSRGYSAYVEASGADAERIKEVLKSKFKK